MKVLLLSAYEAQSHLYWRHALQEMFANWEWTCLTLPPRYFNWRIRGNSLTWSQTEGERLRQHYDLCIATSMVDLATLRGLVPELSRVPTVLYFHENQFAYPISEAGKADKTQQTEAQMVQLYSALAADWLCFNSQHNRDSFAAGVGALLAKLPDHVPSGIVESLLAKQSVIAVPLKNDVFDRQVGSHQSQEAVVEVVWNHRWEYDKGPERLLAFIELLPADMAVRFHIIGQSFRQYPACFDDIHRCLTSRKWLGRWAYVDSRSEYLDVLAQADVVLSTALHDFQGLSVLEAIALNCQPLLPKRLSYPEFCPAQFLYASKANIAAEAQGLKNVFCGEHFYQGILKSKVDANSKCLRTEVKKFSQRALKPAYCDVFGLCNKL